MDDQDSLTMQDFDGLQSYPRLYHRDGQSDAIDLNGASVLDNSTILNGHLLPRPTFHPMTGSIEGAARIHNFKNDPGDDRHLVLGPGGKLYDDRFSISTPILTITGMTDFSMVTINSRAFITPHDRNKGMVSQFVYIWDPQLMTVARKAAGAKPTGTFTISTGTVDGTSRTEPGEHVLSVAFEYDTGFITKPSLFVKITMPNPRAKIDLDAIPTGPTGVVARHILMSHRIFNFDGNMENPELFFAIRIADNTTTVLADGVNKYDTELIKSAEYLKNILEEIPAGVNIGLYQSRMVVVGENADGNTARISQAGDYETFLATEGFLRVPKVGGTVKNLVEIRGILYLFKSMRTLATQDNGQAPIRWEVPTVDDTYGCECFGVAQLPSGGAGLIRGGALVNTHYGLYFFNGQYDEKPLTHKIGSTFTEMLLSSTAQEPGFNGWQLCLDTFRHHIFVFVPQLVNELNQDQFTQTQILHGEYSRGLSWQTIRWSTWTFWDFIQCILIDLNSNHFLPKLMCGTSGKTLLESTPEDGEALFVDTDKDGSVRGVPWRYISGDALAVSPDGDQDGVHSVTIRVAGLGFSGQRFHVIVHSVDDGSLHEFGAVHLDPRADISEPTPKTYVSKGQALGERFKVELHYLSQLPPADSGFRISKIMLNAHHESEEDPA